MIRVMHIIATLDRAGTEQQMVHLCRRMKRNEFVPAVCCLTHAGPLLADLESADIPVHILHKRGRWDLRVIPRAIRVIKEHQPHIVHTWLPTANTLGRAAALAAQVPVLIASERAADIWKGPLRRFADRILAARTLRIITNSDAVRRFLANRIGLSHAKISVIPNGLDLAEFDAAAALHPESATPDTAGELIIGTVGRLEPQKGMKYLIDAFAQLPHHRHPAQLWIIGSGPDERMLRNRAQLAGVLERVKFLGQRSDVPALLSHFDLFVLPSLWEGLPNAVLEAMAASRAVVATAVHGTVEAVEQEKTGFLVPAGDPDALAGAMEKLLGDPNLRQAFGTAGRHKVAAEFSMERMVSETQAVYRAAFKEVIGPNE